MAPAPTAKRAWRTCATLQPSPGTPSRVDMQNTHSRALILFFPCLLRLTTCMPRHFYALASLAFAACVWLAWNRASASDYLDLAHQLILRSMYCARGSV